VPRRGYIFEAVVTCDRPAGEAIYAEQIEGVRIVIEEDDRKPAIHDRMMRAETHALSSAFRTPWQKPTAIGLVLLLLIAGDTGLWGYALFTGLGQGVAFLNAKIWADYYGRAFVGSIRGVLTPIQVVSGLGGPLLAAVIFDSTGSYDVSFSICAAALVVATGAIWLAKPPRRKETEAV